MDDQKTNTKNTNQIKKLIIRKLRVNKRFRINSGKKDFASHSENELEEARKKQLRSV